jgi:hypothetical protein
MDPRRLPSNPLEVAFRKETSRIASDEFVLVESYKVGSQGTLTELPRCFAPRVQGRLGLCDLILDILIDLLDIF